MDNITNKATGLTKEMLDMTYPNKYYNDVINPAKLGQGPIPSKTQMMYQNLKSGGPFKAMFIGAQPGKYGERAMPTGPAKAALGGFGTAARTAFSLPMTAGALAQQGLYSLNKPSTPAGFNYAQNLDRNSISSIADETAGLDYQQDYMQAVMDADKNYTGVTGAKMNLEEEFNPTLYSSQDDIDRRNIGVPQDSRFSGIMKNVARGPLFQGGAMAGNAIGSALGMANPLFALAGGIGSQFLNLNNRPSNLDYSYVNQPGGISLNDNKIQDPDNILSGLNFASGYGSNNLGTMYENFISKMDEREEKAKAKGRTLTEKQIGKRQLAKNRLEDYLYGGAMIPGTNMSRNQFANDYNKGIGQFATPDYDQLDTQSYTGSTASGGLGGGEQADGSYNDPYDPGTDD
jgi:hypothetical protein